MTDEPGDDDFDGNPLPYGRLVSAVEAEKLLGIPATTVRTWHHRSRFTGLFSAGLDRYSRPLFYEADLLVRKMRMRIRDKDGRRHHTMADVERLKSRGRG